MKEIIDQLNLIKIKNVCSVKDNDKGLRIQATDREKILKRHC